MAALQGKGAFGAPAPPQPPPKPASERPKWRPPPVVSRPDDDDPQLKQQEAVPALASPSATSACPVLSPSELSATGDHVTEARGDDEEEEEKQRRAAIAARMARIGGARLGVAPPVFGRKQSLPKPESPMEEITVISPKQEEKASAADIG
jgi:myosin tail region-interacting protein MTI1